MIRVAVLGAGRIGQIHAANVAANPLAQLVAVVDPIDASARKLADKLGCEASTDAEATIARADVDAVVIGTPSDTHAYLMLLAARAGKAVLCEKPVDNDLAKADAAVAELKALGAKVMMAFNRRFDPSNIELRRAIDAGDIGEVRQVIISSRDPGLPPRDYVAHSGGIFRDMAIHDFDMARFLLGEEPVEVYAKASRVVDPALMEEFDDYDTLMVIMQTASGKQCHINCCREASYGYDQRFEILGAKGMLMNDNLRPSTVRRYNAQETEALPPLLNFFLQRYTDAYRNELDAFLKALDAGTAMPTSPWDGRQALRLAEAAIESVKTGRAVVV
ncbi:myo-inositol 2-dehydrogenase [Sphaerotilus hippei]|uniref:Myo-inositol 2-dehydrogenase n=1 Tax=Sphaerotilus hippei TaxID=744406 RepID=A0A318H659_9BURK|nr:inositol 2-dehydrogenase [Sphaerotilus hippei]PXW99457.1 myo-inositol 2-dehydrogenase [Sphaerotilus hippei]